MSHEKRIFSKTDPHVCYVMSMPRPGHTHKTNEDSHDNTPLSKLALLTHSKDALSSGPYCEVIAEPSFPTSADEFKNEMIGTNIMLNNLIIHLKSELKVFAQVLPSGKQIRLRNCLTKAMNAIDALKYPIEDSGADTVSVMNSPPLAPKRPVPMNCRSKRELLELLGPIKGSEKTTSGRTGVNKRRPRVAPKVGAATVKDMLFMARESTRNEPPTTRSQVPSKPPAKRPCVVRLIKPVMHTTPCQVLSNTPIRSPDESNDIAIIDTIIRNPYQLPGKNAIPLPITDTVNLVSSWGHSTKL